MIDLDILVLLDRSGSMQSMKADHEGGLRSFVEDQRRVDGDARLTLVQFDSADPCEIVYDRAPLADVGEIVLLPRGSTPLLDALGRAVSHLRTRQAAAPSAQTVLMVVTDGEENTSQEWDLPRVKSLLAEVQAAGWTVLYLGANVDAFAEAGALGVPVAASMGFAAAGVSAAYGATSSNLRRGRAAAAGVRPGMRNATFASAMAYTADQREAATGARPGGFRDWADKVDPSAAGSPDPSTTTGETEQ